MTVVQNALPLDEETPPGLAFAPDLIDPCEESTLIEDINRLDLPQFVFQRWTSRRRTRSYGYAYDFHDARFAATELIPAFLLPFKARAADFAGVADETLVQASVISYEPGAGIGWHRDRRELGTVIGISLGTAASMRFRHRSDGGTKRAAKLLPPRSVYHLAGDARHEWEHSISPGKDFRWSVTFRGLTDVGRTRMSSDRFR